MLTVRISEDTITPEINRKIRELSAAERRQMMAEIGREFVSMTRENFGPSKPNRPAYWPALSPAYQKRINYFGPPKLILSGKLMESIQIGRVFDNSVTVETDVPYAAVHQFGGGNNIPARPYFPVERDITSWDGYALTPYAAARIKAILEAKFR